MLLFHTEPYNCRILPRRRVSINMTVEVVHRAILLSGGLLITTSPSNMFLGLSEIAPSDPCLLIFTIVSTANEGYL